ncbi:MAG: thiamine biosynthesis protein ThiF [Planctomycetes bacterium RBG_13_63_9]|nr:MAG: thiamine biosynthesis protein ThiF [Planctomycetes bacterium RBG_13_63_9]
MLSDSRAPANLDRYVRQVRYAPLGKAGQRRLLRRRALVCGCGALGSMLANTLVRAGVGAVRIVDRDFVETNNLQRQFLFTEDDVAAGLPKAVAAAERLRCANSEVEIEPIVADVDYTNIEQLCDGVDVIVDGTDNFETRFLVNDLAVRQGIPWVYGGCLGAEGQTMTILPGETPCLRCLLQECPPPGSTPTCDTAGILAPIVGVIASIEAIEAIKILSGDREAVSRNLTVVELWDNRIRQVDVSTLRDQVDCPTCKHREFPWLSGRQGSHTAVLCGRNAVQLSHGGTSVALDELAGRLEGIGQVTRNQYLLRLKVDDYELTVFPDGRAIIGGTDNVTTARTLYAKYVGS